MGGYGVMKRKIKADDKKKRKEWNDLRLYYKKVKGKD